MIILHALIGGLIGEVIMLFAIIIGEVIKKNEELKQNPAKYWE